MRILVPPTRVLIRAPSWLGDFVACEPVLRALCARWTADRRADRLTIAAPAPFLALLDGRFEGVRRLPIARGAAPDTASWRAHDVALLLDGSWRSAWGALRAGIPERIGWSSGGRSVLLTSAVRPALERGAIPLGLGIHGRGGRRLPRPFAAACVELVALAGLDVRDRAPRLEPEAAALVRAEDRLRARGVDPRSPFVLVNAGARPGSAKAADPDLLARIARSSALPLVLACGPGEEANARATLARLSRSRAVLLDDPPPPLPDLLALLALSTGCITADSGPRHLAQALAKPTIVVCGPTDPRHTAEHGTDVSILRAEVECGPCHREVCPNSGERERLCMRSIDANAIRAFATGAGSRRSRGGP
ncbi:MAG: glycosyltransferase family 9 protein [Planctomycetota bacterium]|nr:glycosyltransferase family 9 protein [Planctomycetota bacterium]